MAESFAAFFPLVCEAIASELVGISLSPNSWHLLEEIAQPIYWTFQPFLITALPI